MIESVRSEPIKKLLKHSTGYYCFTVLMLLSHFVSFPIYTRILSVAEYGILAYISTLVVFTVAICKIGLQHSAVRFYSEFEHDKKKHEINRYYSTIYSSPIIIGIILACVFLLTMNWSKSLFDDRLAAFLGFAIITVPLRSAVSTFTQFLRAEQNVRFFALLGLVERYGCFILNITLILFVTKNLWGYYYGSLIWYIILFSYTFFYMSKKRDYSVKYFSPSFLRTSVLYGVPMLGYEICSQFLELGDRLLLKSFLGVEAVALYSVGYNIPMYISNLFGGPLRLAIVPIYIDTWAKNGVDETKQFLSRALSCFSLVAIPAIFGTCAIRKEIVVTLASSRYAVSDSIVPYVIIGTMLFAASSIVSAGLLIYKKTYILTISPISGCILNILLNFYLIPKLGITGAALSTLASYSFAFFIIAYFSYKLLSFPINYRRIGVSVFASCLMLLVLEQLDFTTALYSLTVKIVTGILIYTSLVLTLDKGIRSDVLRRFNKLRPILTE